MHDYEWAEAEPRFKCTPNSSYYAISLTVRSHLQLTVAKFNEPNEIALELGLSLRSIAIPASAVLRPQNIGPSTQTNAGTGSPLLSGAYYSGASPCG